MNKTQTKWFIRKNDMISQYGEDLLIRAYRLNRFEGEGPTAISEYTQIPRGQVSLACRIGEELNGKEINL